MGWHTSSLLYTRHNLLKRFSLRLIKSVRVVYVPDAERRMVAGVWAFYERCMSPGATKSNPQCKVEIEYDYTGERVPELLVEFEDGRRLHFADASYMPMSLIMEAVHLKKRKITHFYSKTNKEFFDEDDEDEQTIKERAAEEAQSAGGRRR